MEKWKYLLRPILFVTIAAFSMGNESCDGEGVPGGEDDDRRKVTRTLKKRAAIGQIQSRPMNIEGGGQFDFAFVANMQLYTLVTESEKFYIPSLDTDAGNGIMMNKADHDFYSKLVQQKSFRPLSEQKPVDESIKCLLNNPQIKLSGAIQSFEFKSKSGFEFGFKDGIAIGNGSLKSGKLNLVKSQLTLDLKALDYLEEGAVLGAGMGVADQNKTEIGFGIDFGLFDLSLKHYFESPLASVTRRALQKALNDTIERVDEEPWVSRVFGGDLDNEIIIRGGRRAGVKEGDIFKIYNVRDYWSDPSKPCRSKYQGWVPSSGEERPVAVIKAFHVGPDITVGLVLKEHQTLINPKIGAVAIWAPKSEESSEPAPKLAAQ